MTLQFIYQRRNIMSNTTKGPFMQAMEKYTKSVKSFISAQGFGHYSKPTAGRLKTIARDITSKKFVSKTWSGATSIHGDYIWTDGENIYYSFGTKHYVLDKTTSIWNTKTWTGLTGFYGDSIWTDGDNIYYSFSTDQYVLDKSTSTWNTKTWTGLTSFNGKNVWTDGENIYHSDGSLSSKQHVLDKATSTWSHKPWIGSASSIYGENIWTDGENIYYSWGIDQFTDQYVLNKATSAWNIKSWSGVTSISGEYIWTDGENIYYSYDTGQYVLNKATSTWNIKSWSDLTSFNGNRIWTDGENIYYSNGSSAQYLLKRNTPTTHEVMGYANDQTQMIAPFFTVPINHNMIYRGQNLGDTLTDAQHIALSSGNFTDLYLGDYWTKTVTIPAGTYTGGDGQEVTVPAQTNITLKAVIADFDTFYAGYASGYAGINTHHAAVIITGFSNVVWNKTNSTAGGYKDSLIHKWLDGSALSQIEAWFGSDKVLWHKKLLTTAITGDAASNWNWSDQKISLLSENQMYGSKVWGNSKAANGGYEPGEAFKHLNVFNHIDANLLFGNKNIWLRDIASAVWAASLNDLGSAHRDVASITRVAPAALILLS